MRDKSDNSGIDVHPTTGDDVLFAPEQMLGGKYKIISLLGQGGMGKVYRVLQVFLNKELALKVLDSHRVSDDVQMRRFQLEAKAAHSLSHPNLVKVHDFGLLDDNQPYLVMDLVEGVTLSDYLHEHGPLGLDQAGPIFAQVCFGLSYAHEQSIVHRDIKPSNIMLASALPLGTEASVKILDFGIAKLASNEGGEIQQLTRTGEIFGSPLYMSPEQCSGAPIDHRSDIYSLGCVLFEALSGTPPHFGINALRTMMLHQSQAAPLLKEASLGKEFPEALEHIVSKMLQKSPVDRYQNLGLVAHDLSRVCADSKLVAPKSTLKAPARAPKVISMTAGRFSALLVLTVVITAIVTAIVTNGIQRTSALSSSALAPNSTAVDQNAVDQNNKQPAPEQNLSEADPYFIDPKKLEKCKLAFERAKPITSIIIMDKGVKQRMFTFPDCAIGTISNRIAVNRSAGTIPYHQWEAKGTVSDVPDGVPLTLHVDGRNYPETLVIPSVLEKISSKEFSGLTITTPVAIDPQVLAESLVKILKTATQWLNLESVSLNSMPENSAVLVELNNLKHLHSLSIEGPPTDMRELAKQPFWGRLNQVTLSKLPADDIVSNLSQSSNLQKLILEDAPISPNSLEKLRRCPHFNYLQIENNSINDQHLIALAQLKSLRGVYFKNVKLTPKQFRMFAQCPQLKLIEVSPISAENLKASNSNDRRIIVSRE